MEEETKRALYSTACHVVTLLLGKSKGDQSNAVILSALNALIALDNDADDLVTIIADLATDELETRSRIRIKLDESKDAANEQWRIRQPWLPKRL